MPSAAESDKLARAAFENNPWLQSRQSLTPLPDTIANWRAASFALMVLLAFSIGGNIWLASTPKIQPYVIQVDEKGFAIPIKPLDSVSGVDQRVIMAQVETFIFNSRIRVMDRNAQLIFAQDAYRSVKANSFASSKLDAYFRSAPPTSAAAPVTIEFDAIVPVTAHTYQANWSEVSTMSDGTLTPQSRYEGLFTVTVSPPSDYFDMLNNPMGVYITDYSIEAVRTYN
jgi:type IV secretion system protein VirB5